MKKLSKVSGCISVIATNFIESMRSRNYSEQTIDTYKIALNRFFAYMVDIKRLQDITEEDLIQYRKYLIEKELKASSIELYIRAVKVFFQHLEREGIIFINPAQYLRNPKAERKIKYVPSLNDMDKLLNTPDIETETGIRNKAILETLYSTGIRLEECVRLNINDVDLTNGLLKINGKGSKERIVPIGKYAIEWIERYLLIRKSDMEALWISEIGRRLSDISIQKMIAKYSKDAGLENISAHSIRRACATHMLDNGASPFAIQTLLGHADLKSLGQYLQVTITDLKKTHANSEVGQ